MSFRRRVRRPASILAPVSANEKRELELSATQLELIGLRLINRGVDLNAVCPACNRQPLRFLNRITYVSMQHLAEALSGKVNEQWVPAVLRACTNCGYIAQHSLGLMGLGDLDPGPRGEEVAAELLRAENSPSATLRDEQQA